MARSESGDKEAKVREDFREENVNARRSPLQSESAAMRPNPTYRCLSFFAGISSRIRHVFELLSWTSF